VCPPLPAGYGLATTGLPFLPPTVSLHLGRQHRPDFKLAVAIILRDALPHSYLPPLASGTPRHASRQLPLAVNRRVVFPRRGTNVAIGVENAAVPHLLALLVADAYIGELTLPRTQAGCPTPTVACGAPTLVHPLLLHACMVTAQRPAPPLRCLCSLPRVRQQRTARHVTFRHAF